MQSQQRCPGESSVKYKKTHAQCLDHFSSFRESGFLYINGGNRMTWFQFYFKIFVLDRLLLILHSEERDESENC